MDFINLNKILDLDPYSLDQQDKSDLFLAAIKEISLHHYTNCDLYAKLCDKRGFLPHCIKDIKDLVYLPASLFKNILLLSIPEDQVFREINSSATTSGTPSRIALDRQTSKRQSKCFNKIIIDRLGNKRRRFIVLDTPDSVSRSNLISARSSTIRSLLFCANQFETCIESVNGKMALQLDKLNSLLRSAEEGDVEIVIFGFTYILYAIVIRALLNMGWTYNLTKSKVIHIGGWKKLEDEKVSSEILNQACVEAFGVKIDNIIDFYGFTEQSGMIYPTCEAGFRHIPVWGELIVRDPVTLKAMPSEQKGLLQFITPIQTSYPGHSVLTEDVGYILNTEMCSCGRKGSIFKIIGRSEDAVELRGCGDIMAERFA